jgi:hypothetical protein
MEEIRHKVLTAPKAKRRRPNPRPIDKSKGKRTDENFFVNSKYIIPWNRIKSMWIAYFGIQEEFPGGVSIRKVRKA